MSRREDFVTKSVRPWGAKATPLTTYFAEIGDTPYGKYGDYREKINIGFSSCTELSLDSAFSTSSI